MKNKVIIIMPAYNAEKTLKKTYFDIPPKYRKNVILVDDSSRDKTVALAKQLGIKTYVHKKNKGYGGNQKTCYFHALKQQADIIVMIHPDYQYDSKLTEKLIEPIIEKRFDIMLGSRIHGRRQAIEGGMPIYKYFSNRFLTLIENIVLGENLSEYHTGFRAFSKNIFQKIPIEKFSDDFVFDQQILISAIRKGYRIGEIFIPVRYLSDSSSINFSRSIKYGIQTLINLVTL